MKIELTNEEANVLANLLNVAVKAVGLEAAEGALHFINKIKQAAAEEAPAEDTEQGSCVTPMGYFALTVKRDDADPVEIRVAISDADNARFAAAYAASYFPTGRSLSCCCRGP